METDTNVFQQPLTKILIILCCYVFVTGKSDLQNCCTLIPMDFIKHKALMFIRGSRFMHLLPAGLKGKTTLPVLWGYRQTALLASFQQLALLNS